MKYKSVYFKHIIYRPVDLFVQINYVLIVKHTQIAHTSDSTRGVDFGSTPSLFGLYYSNNSVYRKYNNRYFCFI